MNLFEALCVHQKLIFISKKMEQNKFLKDETTERQYRSIGICMKIG